MKLSSFRKRERLRKHSSRLLKKVRRTFAAPTETVPVFVLGRQRSGTTMLMIVLEIHPQTDVFDEARDSVAFQDYCLRDLGVIDALLQSSRAPFACFKPLCDSHRIDELLQRYPTARCIWMFRDYRDVSNSVLRKFEDPNHAVRLVAEGREGGDGFRRELSPATLNELKKVYHQALTEFDLAALTWYARNKILVETGAASSPGMCLVKYEDIVTRPQEEIRRVLTFAGMRLVPSVVDYVHARSIGRHSYPPLDPGVAALCDELTRHLDDLYAANRALHAGPVPAAV